MPLGAVHTIIRRSADMVLLDSYGPCRVARLPVPPPVQSFADMPIGPRAPRKDDGTGAAKCESGGPRAGARKPSVAPPPRPRALRHSHICPPIRSIASAALRYSHISPPTYAVCPGVSTPVVLAAQAARTHSFLGGHGIARFTRLPSRGTRTNSSTR